MRHVPVLIFFSTGGVDALAGVLFTEWTYGDYFTVRLGKIENDWKTSNFEKWTLRVEE